MGRGTWLHLRKVQQSRKVQATRLPMSIWNFGRQTIRASYHFFDFSEAEFRHDFSELLSDKEEEVDDVLRLSSKFFAKFRILGRNSDRAGIQVALAHHDATFG